MTTRPVALSIRINTPISTAELRRRWRLVRAAMTERGIDVLVMQSPHEMAGGYVRWFTDVVVTDQPVVAVFPRDDDMTLLMHGPFDGDETVPNDGHETLRGVQRVLTAPMFPAAAYTGGYIADLLVKVLAPYADGTIGVVGEQLFSFVTLDCVRRALPDATMTEASDLVDEIKAVKSEEEQRLIRSAAELQDAVMRTAFAAIAPGKRDSDITAVARCFAQELGSESGILLCGSAPPGVPATIGNLHMQHRVIDRGDAIALLVEVNGPGGLYAELGRTAVLGSATRQLREEFELAVEAQSLTVSQLRPGASPAVIWESHNAWMREHGLPTEARIHCHGQGYDFVERPLVRPDEPMVIQAGMNFACHPGFVRDGIQAWICDNFLVCSDGTQEHLHAFPRQIVEL